MIQKHTPGPWGTGEASWNEEGEVRYTLHGVYQAKSADASLIAAAPELFESLEQVLRCAIYDEGVSNEVVNAVSSARAAIKKAKGES